MTEDQITGDAVRAPRRRSAAGLGQTSFDGASPDEVVALLEAASRLPAAKLRRVLAAVREALAEEARAEGR